MATTYLPLRAGNGQESRNEMGEMPKIYWVVVTHCSEDVCIHVTGTQEFIAFKSVVRHLAPIFIYRYTVKTIWLSTPVNVVQFIFVSFTFYALYISLMRYIMAGCRSTSHQNDVLQRQTVLSFNLMRYIKGYCECCINIYCHGKAIRNCQDLRKCYMLCAKVSYKCDRSITQFIRHYHHKEYLVKCQLGVVYDYRSGSVLRDLRYDTSLLSNKILDNYVLLVEHPR